jgi:hypothetical protein
MSLDMHPWEDQEEYCHRVEVHLALAAVDPADPESARFALAGLDPPCLPNRPLKAGGSSFAAAKGIFRELTGTDPSLWYPVNQVRVLDGPQHASLIILYAMTIPSPVPLLDKSVRWVDIDELSKHPFLHQMMGLACKFNRMENESC